MKKIVILVSVVVILAVTAFFWFSQTRQDDASRLTPSPTVTTVPTVPNNTGNGQEVVTPESQLVYVGVDYRQSVNADITLEQIQNSKLVRSVQILNEGSSVATAHIFIFKAEVIEISGRTLTLTKEGDTLSIYIGENVDISLIEGNSSREEKLGEIEVGDFVNVGAILQFGRNDPLWVQYLTILRD